MTNNESAVSATRADAKCVAGEITGSDLFYALSYISENAVSNAWKDLESQTKKYRDRYVLSRILIILIVAIYVITAATFAYPHICYLLSDNKYKNDIDVYEAYAKLDFHGLRTEAVVKEDSHLGIGKLYEGDYIPLYGYSSVSFDDKKDFEKDMLLAVINALGLKTDLGKIEPDKYGVYDIDGYKVDMFFSREYNTVSISDENHLVPRILLKGKRVSISADATDDEIKDSVSAAADILFESFGVSFSDIKILRYCKNEAEDAVERKDNSVTVVFYNSDDHPLNEYGKDGVNCNYIHHWHNGVVSDNIAIRFEYSDSEKTAYASSVKYTAYSAGLVQVSTAKKTSFEKAKELLAEGLAFGAHSCRFCTEETPYVDFKNYDYVELQYTTATDNFPALPFYVFYKHTGETEDGKKIFSLAYVPAIEISGYEEYFSSLTESHGKSASNGEVISKAEINEILSGMELLAFDVADDTTYTGELLSEYLPWSVEGLTPYITYNVPAKRVITFMGESYECTYEKSYRRIYSPFHIDKYVFDGGYFELYGGGGMIVGMSLDDPSQGIYIANKSTLINNYVNDENGYSHKKYIVESDNKVYRYVGYRTGWKISDYYYVDYVDIYDDDYSSYKGSLLFGFYFNTVGNFENLDPAIQNRIYALRSDKAKELVKSKIESVCEGYAFYGFHDPVAVVLEDGTVNCLYRTDVTYPNGETRQVNIIFK
ncbi:MAG: hypothetical protein J6V56_02710 [Clostridia bacterium]|nr:hypothetical protein [Clostridia bacterium]